MDRHDLKRLSWLSLAAIFLLLTLIAVTIVHAYRTSLFDGANDQMSIERHWIESVLLNALQHRDYQSIDNLVKEWGRERPDVVSIRVTSANGVVLGAYQRDAPAASQVRQRSTLAYSYNSEASLEFARDFSSVSTQALKGTAAVAVVSVLLFILYAYFIRQRIQGRITADLLRGQAKALEDGNLDLQQEIDERKRVEGALRDNERRLAEAQRIGRMGSWERDTGSDMVLWSRELYRMFGVSRGRFVTSQENIIDIVHGDDRALLESALDGLENGTPYDLDYRLRLRDGQVRTVHEKAEVQLDIAGRPLRLRGTVHDITERKEAEQRLDRSYRSFSAILNSMDSLVYIADLETYELLFVNDYGKDIWGDVVGQICWKSLQQGQSGPCEFCTNDRIVDEHGQATGIHAWEFQNTVNERWYDCRDQAIRWFDGRLVRMEIATDITERKLSETQLRLAGMVFENTTEAIMVTDPDGVISSVNTAFTNITGYTVQEAVGETPRILQSGRHDEEFYADMWKSLAKQGRWEGEIWNRRKNGEVYPEWLSISAIRDAHGQTVQYVCLFIDISKRKAAEEQIRYRANYDVLTDLPNRAMFYERLEHALKQARRKDTSVGVLLIDLDRFKNVNDTLGHQLGDLLLQQTARRLEDCVRDSDTAARPGGDEFMIMLPDIAEAEDAAKVAEKIVSQLSERYVLEGQEAFIGASIGIAIFPDDADDLSTMLKNADLAMYQAKEAGRNTYRFFTPAMTRKVMERRDLDRDLRRAVTGNEFDVYYQPVVDGATGRVVSAEALVRWNHPVDGLTLPDRFIPVAEETGLIAPIGEWVLRSACHQVHSWREAGLKIDISVNLSSRQIKRGLSSDTLAAILKETGIPAPSLTLEITESLLLEETEQTISWLHAVKDLGVHLSVDDFGTGYSSLSYLKRFPVDVVKIDRSFIRDVTTDPSDASLVEAIIAIGRSLNLKVVAEGVETAEQLRFARDRGCDLVQGHYFSEPIPPDLFRRYLEQNSAAALWSL